MFAYVIPLGFLILCIKLFYHENGPSFVSWSTNVLIIGWKYTEARKREIWNFEINIIELLSISLKYVTILVLSIVSVLLFAILSEAPFHR